MHAPSRIRAHPHVHTYFCMHAYRYITRATDTCERSSPLSLSLSRALFFAFAALPPRLSFLLSLSPSRIPFVRPSLSLSLPSPLPPTALFKYPLPNFLLSLSLSLCFSLLHSLPLLLPAFVSFYSVRSLSVFPKLLPLSLAIAYTVEAAQAAEGHRSQLWTYLDRRAKSEVLDLLCSASLSVDARSPWFYYSDATTTTTITSNLCSDFRSFFCPCQTLAKEGERRACVAFAPFCFFFLFFSSSSRTIARLCRPISTVP